MAKTFYCVTDHNPSHPNIKDIFSKYWQLNDRSSSTRELLSTNIVYGHYRPKNLSDFLVHSDVAIKPNIKYVPPKCHKPFKCIHCPHLIKKGMIVSTSTSRKYKIPRTITCNSQNLIYCIECNLCKKQYVGQTKNKLLTRINQHRGDIKHKRETPVSRHFNDHICDYSLYILQLINS